MLELEKLLEKQKELSKLMGMNIVLVDSNGSITNLGIYLLLLIVTDMASDIFKWASSIVESSKTPKGNVA